MVSAVRTIWPAKIRPGISARVSCAGRPTVADREFDCGTLT